jgi:hypothetical protein
MIIPRCSRAEVLAMDLRQLGPRSARWAAPRPANSGMNAIGPLRLTGWGATHTTWTPHGTTHAVQAEQVERRLAVCGALLVVVDLTRGWSGEDTADADACRRCTELLTGLADSPVPVPAGDRAAGVRPSIVAVDGNHRNHDHHSP